MFSAEMRWPCARARGVLVVELALVLLVFLMVTLGVLELARLAYLFNTLQAATRRAARAAALTDFTDAAAQAALRRAALFSDRDGPIVLGAPITPDYLRIDYLGPPPDGGGMPAPIPRAALPACPARNRLLCHSVPADPACIRFVRVRICLPEPEDRCVPAPYTPLLSILPLQLDLPTALAIKPAQSLGFSPGAELCP